MTLVYREFHLGCDIYLHIIKSETGASDIIRRKTSVLICLYLL